MGGLDRSQLKSRASSPVSGSRPNSAMRIASRLNNASQSRVGWTHRRSQITFGGGPALVARSKKSESALTIVNACALAYSQIVPSVVRNNPTSATCFEPGYNSASRPASRREILVEKQLHRATRFPTRAAYSYTARKSSGSSSGYSLRISCSDMPAASHFRTSQTVIRRPRIQGWPDRFRCSMVILSATIRDTNAAPRVTQSPAATPWPPRSGPPSPPGAPPCRPPGRRLCFASSWLPSPGGGRLS